MLLLPTTRFVKVVQAVAAFVVLADVSVGNEDPGAVRGAVYGNEVLGFFGDWGFLCDT